MKVINAAPATNGAYTPIQEWPGLVPPNGCCKWPDSLDTADFYAYNGFVTLTIVRGMVQSYQPNVEAWEAWKASLPPEPEPTPTVEERVASLETAIADGLNLYEGDLGNG